MVLRISKQVNKNLKQLLMVIILIIMLGLVLIIMIIMMVMMKLQMLMNKTAARSYCFVTVSHYKLSRISNFHRCLSTV